MSAVLSYSPVSPARPRRAADRALSLADLTTLVGTVCADPTIWQPRLQIPDGEQRWWTRLSTDRHVDVWLLSWLPGHTTELHDHGTSAAAFSVVRGSLVEVRAEQQGRRRAFLRQPGWVTWLAPGVIHDVSGAGDEPAVSIHAYSPPLEQMNYYGADDLRRLRIVRSVRTDQPEQELSR
jgi:predicted metal-dependent enzyme (double-stranded beta helix superfamily)